MATNTTRVESELMSRSRGRDRSVRRHKLPLCRATGLARYRDRHQARQGAKVMLAGTCNYEVSTFACPECRGFHVEKTSGRKPLVAATTTEPAEAFISSLATRRRRFFIVDIECLTHGAKATPDAVAKLWRILREEAPGIAHRDRVLVGAAQKVTQRYRSVIDAPNVSWVVAADVKDGADRALLGAFDLWRTARDFDELVICSGDGHAFTDLAIRAKRSGLTVHVVTTQAPAGERPILSRRLAAAADLRSVVRLQARTARHTNPVPLTAAA